MPPSAPENLRIAPPPVKKPFPWVWVIAGAVSMMIILVCVVAAVIVYIRTRSALPGGNPLVSVQETIAHELGEPVSPGTPQWEPVVPEEEAIAVETEVVIEELVVEEPSKTPLPPTLPPTWTATPTPTYTATPLPSPTFTPVVINQAVNLAYVQGAVEDTDIYIRTESGTTSCAACNSCDESDPEFSPDGRYLIYQSTCGGSYDIWRVSLNGGSPEQLTATYDFDEREPHFSPDGSTIIYQRLPDDEGRFIPGEIWIMNADGSGSYPLGVVGRNPVYSPDGRSIAYMSNTSGRWQIYVYSISTGASRQLTSCDSNCRWPEWSPDGRYIAYNVTISATNLDPDGIEFIPVDGGSATVLIRDQACGRPTWSASGWIAFNSPRGVERIRPDGSDRSLVIDRTDAWGPSYSR